MDPRPTRITRSEILTPHEFLGLESNQNPAARVGGARIELVRHRDRTRIGTCYQQVPIRLMPPFSVGAEPASLLYLITLSAGLMDGDGHLIEVAARSGTRALVTGQSASRIHPALSSYASQQWSVSVEDDAYLVVLPGPAIPFHGSRYYQRARVELAQTARLIWGDIWLAGRYDRGALSERFQFERIVQDFEARRAGDLIYRDRFRWDGPWSSNESGWYFGGELATASLFVAGPSPEIPPVLGPEFRRSTFQLGPELSCLRWYGQPSALPADVARVALTIAGSWTGGPEAPPWFLGSSELAPNHWFY